MWFSRLRFVFAAGKWQTSNPQSVTLNLCGSRAVRENRAAGKLVAYFFFGVSL